LKKTTEKREVIKVRAFSTDPARVAVRKGLTLSVAPGSYEFARIDVTVEVPCYVEEIKEVYEQVNDYVSERMTEEQELFESKLPEVGEDLDVEKVL
jgi:hypothetical protein